MSKQTRKTTTSNANKKTVVQSASGLIYYGDLPPRRRPKPEPLEKDLDTEQPS